MAVKRPTYPPDTTLVAEARQLAINISRASETGLTAQITKEHARLWK